MSRRVLPTAKCRPAFVRLEGRRDRRAARADDGRECSPTAPPDKQLLQTACPRKDSVTKSQEADHQNGCFLVRSRYERKKAPQLNRRTKMAGTKQWGKKDKTTAAPAEEEKERSLEEQLDRAEVVVCKARDATAFLHEQWRTHLFRISFLVLLVSFHQCRLPMNECMTNIKVRSRILCRSASVQSDE